MQWGWRVSFDIQSRCHPSIERDFLILPLCLFLVFNGHPMSGINQTPSLGPHRRTAFIHCTLHGRCWTRASSHELSIPRWAWALDTSDTNKQSTSTELYGAGAETPLRSQNGANRAIEWAASTEHGYMDSSLCSTSVRACLRNKNGGPADQGETASRPRQSSDASVTAVC
ncbi:hypothetical protein B0T24DRAFT_343576 [Lasiosphaeria ovina]|uniref:Uncharacterized protein n=1 Tax=Lasiosphaeria ovina TaxID=92902 RepID=A0AAE0K3G8_9PEZI|nr:hypothetical protein B0T24DRAFT_343576 [Lasiosphaeria ovina]